MNTTAKNIAPENKLFSDQGDAEKGLTMNPVAGVEPLATNQLVMIHGGDNVVFW